MTRQGLRRPRPIVALGVLCALTFTAQLGAQSSDGAAARANARRYRETNEVAILREYRELLALPNVASDLPNIRRNADLLLQMLRRRGATAQLLDTWRRAPSGLW